tara:strand:+ start:278 stop:640 length:363 start_codon:yes stop_codon:yes gene_type:complete
MRDISQSQWVNCYLARRYVGLNLSQQCALYRKTGDEPRKGQHADTQRLAPLSEEVLVFRLPRLTYSITLIGCSQGSLSRRGEEVIRKVFTENDCSTLTDLESKSWFNYLSLYYINKERGK